MAVIPIVISDLAAISFPQDKNGLFVHQKSVVMGLVCCVMPSESWGQRAPPLLCSTLCRGSVPKSSRNQMALARPVLVSFVFLLLQRHKMCFLNQWVKQPHWSWCPHCVQLWWRFPALVWLLSKTLSLWLQSPSLPRLEPAPPSKRFTPSSSGTPQTCFLLPI